MGEWSGDKMNYWPNWQNKRYSPNSIICLQTKGDHKIQFQSGFKKNVGGWLGIGKSWHALPAGETTT